MFSRKRIMKKSITKSPPFTRPPSKVVVFTTLLAFACLSSFSLAFKYESSHPWELMAPRTLCASGVPSGKKVEGDNWNKMADSVLGPCPQTLEEMEAYDAIVMDEHGYVDVTISGVRFSYSRGEVGTGTKRILLEEDDEVDQNEDEEEQPDENEDNEREKDEVSKDEANDVITQQPSQSNIKEVHTANIEKSNNMDTSSRKKDLTSHIQVYLVSLDIGEDDFQTDDKSAFISYSDFLDKGLCCYEYVLAAENDEGEQKKSVNDLLKECKPMDLRPLVPRTGRNQMLSSPISVSTSSSDAETDMPAVVSARFRPVGRGRHMVVISNCAAEIIYDSNEGGSKNSANPILAHFDKIEFKFVSKFGELPNSLKGIIPFYSVMLALYATLALVWFRRSRGIVGCQRPKGQTKDKVGKPCLLYASAVTNICPAQQNGEAGHGTSVHAPPLLGLQLAIYSLVLLQLAFTAVAFAYYVHLNATVVDIDILYGGTMAALASWTPFSALVALVHFVTFLSCQSVVMLATDGTWLIQSTVRSFTKKALYALGTAWAAFFVAYGFLSREERVAISFLLGGIWVAFLLFNVRRSLRHLKSIMVGASNETVMAAGGALVAKRSMYRKMCAVVAIYPLIFLAGVIWNAEWQRDSWAWVGYVLGDVYVFAILLHASIAWMPRPLAAMEFAKYSPLVGNSRPISAIDDAEFWQEEINYNFDENENDNVELS